MQPCAEFTARWWRPRHIAEISRRPRAAACWAMAPAWIWNLHEKWFSLGLVPIVDFVHALTYSVCDGDRAGFKCRYRTLAIVFSRMTLCWQGMGSGTGIRTDLEARLACLEPHARTQANWRRPDPREALRRTLTYLKNNEPRMNYSEYRKQGLPRVIEHGGFPDHRKLNLSRERDGEVLGPPRGSGSDLAKGALLGDDDRFG